MENALIARQPIFDGNGGIYAYELLFRDSKQNFATVTDNRHATATVLANTFNTFGLDRIVESSKAFINVDKAFLFDDVIESIPPSRFVLEILESVEVDNALLTRIETLKSKGYAFALDDMSMSDENIEQFRPLFEMIDIAKIDFSLTRNIDTLQQKMAQLSAFDITFLAEKVENVDTYEYCKYLGFEYFQGYYFERPKILEAKKLEPGHVAVIKMVELVNGGAEIQKIEKEFNHNPGLTLNMLRYINSSHFSTQKEICSIAQAVNLLGRHTLLQWLILNLYSSTKQNKYKNYILQAVMLRAEIMFTLAQRRKLTTETANKAYLIGLLSLLDALLHIPKADIFSEFSFDKEITDAVLSHRGTLGTLLKIATVFEQGDFSSIRQILGKIKMNKDELSTMLSQCYVKVINRQSYF